jgi:hypothetical protein
MEWQWFIDALGWLGSLILVSAYFMVSYNRISASSPLYQWMNLVGSVLLLINTAFYGAFPSSFVNVVWGIIAIAALYRILRQPIKL